MTLADATGVVMVIKWQKIRKDIRMNQRKIIKNRDCYYLTFVTREKQICKNVVYISTDIITKSFME
jgi:hypothetical protein